MQSGKKPTSKRYDDPIRPDIVDDTMIPSQVEAAKIADTVKDTHVDKEKKKPPLIPKWVVVGIIAIIVITIIVLLVYYYIGADIASYVNNNRKDTAHPSGDPQSSGVPLPSSGPPPSGGPQSSGSPPPKGGPSSDQSSGNPPSGGPPPLERVSEDDWDKYQQSVNDGHLTKYIKTNKTPTKNIHHQNKEDIVLDMPNTEPNGDGDIDITEQVTRELQYQIKTEDDNISVVSMDSTSNECEFVLLSGKNKGKVCGGKCSGDAVRCGRHVGK